MTHAPRYRQGFTLVELLVATLLLTVVMGSVYTMFYAVLVPWRAVEQDYDAYRETRNAMTLFEREVNNLVPTASYLFEGEKDEITLFLVSEPMDVEKSEGRHLLRVRYRFKSGANELVREEAQVTSPLPQVPPDGTKVDRTRVKTEKEIEHVLAANVEDFSIRYIWLPAPEGRTPEIPPTPIVPLYATKHEERWGYPQGIEVKLTLRDPENKEATHTVSRTIALPVPGALLTMQQLSERLGSSMSS